MEKRSFEPRFGASLDPDEARATDEIHAQIAQPEPYSTIFFCSSRYDLPRLAAALRRAFSGPLIGCTSAGQIGQNGYQRGGITAVSLPSSALCVSTWALGPLDRAASRAAEIGREVRLARAASPAGRRAFGLLLIDGLSLAEERVASALGQALVDLPMIGGSAGDDLAFEATHVFDGVAFRADAATLSIFETELPFRIIKREDVVPAGTMLVVTRAAPERRSVIEINGKPAATEYARLVGARASELDADVFAAHPLLVRIEDDYYVRAISQVCADGSLTFFCAIDAGLVLHLGRSVEVVEGLDAALGSPTPDLVLACDCVLRRIEQERRGVDAEVGRALARHRVFGFSTYGEQLNAVHVNQTLVGVCLGGAS